MFINDSSITRMENCQILEVFDFFDKDNEGLITTKELGDIMKALGTNPLKLNEQWSCSKDQRPGAGGVLIYI